MWTFVVAILDFGSHLGFYKDITTWLGIQIFHINALGANFKELYLFQASYTEYAISMIYGGHFEFWRPSWILKRC